MPRSIRRSEKAISDLTGHYRYIRRDDPAAADRFLAQAEATFATFADMPGIGRRWASANPRLSGVRVFHLPSPFESYLVFYREDNDRISILRVLHGARDLAEILK